MVSFFYNALEYKNFRFSYLLLSQLAEYFAPLAMFAFALTRLLAQVSLLWRIKWATHTRMGLLFFHLLPRKQEAKTKTEEHLWVG